MDKVESYQRHTILKYYGKYSYIYKGKGASGTNGKVREFTRIRAAFLLFNVAAALAAIAFALVLLA